MTLEKRTNIHNNLNNRLSVQVSLTGLSFLVAPSTIINSGEALQYSNVVLEKATTPEEILEELEVSLEQPLFKNQNFKEVVIIHNTSLYTLVPLALFDDKKTSEYLKFNTKLLATDFVAYDVLEKQQIVVVYVPLININNFFFDTFGSFEYYHAATILIKTLSQLDFKANGECAYVSVEKSMYHLLIYKDGALQLCNSYAYHTPEDFLYYILFAFEQLHLSTEKSIVKIFGDITEESDTFKLLYKYIRNITFLDTKLETIQIADTTEPINHFILKNIP